MNGPEQQQHTVGNKAAPLIRIHVHAGFHREYMLKALNDFSWLHGFDNR